MPNADVNAVVAFLAGVASFVSPCVLPLIPTYLAYLAGVSLAELSQAGEVQSGTRVKLVTNSLAFVLGFSLVFVLLGLSASAVGQFLLRNQGVLRKISGVVIILLGLHTAGVMQVPLLNRDKRPQVRRVNSGPGAAFLFGLAFSAGWTPCIGPILATILMLAGSRGSVGQGVMLLALYSLGLAVPFLLSAVFFGSFLPLLRGLTRFLGRISFTAGLLLVLLGLMIYFNSFARLAGWLQWGL